jgi:NAD(P)-dependent dehydrogenase (short-subunit alcohol dehydrogenase family)
MTISHFGGVDILVNNAAITFVGGLDQPLKRHDLTMEVNYRAPLIAIREVYRSMEQRGGGAIINVSSQAALLPLPDMIAYGTSKVALEHLTLDAARELHPKGIAVNCFRIDVPVASEGFVANTPGADRSGWEPAEVPVEGILWMLRQPPSYTGHRESMYFLRKREGIMASRAVGKGSGTIPTTELFDGLFDMATSMLRRTQED